MQRAPDVHLSRPFVPLASTRSESVAAEPTTLEASNAAPPGDDSIAVAAPNIPEVEETVGQDVLTKPFNYASYICLKVLAKILQITQVPHKLRRVN